MARRFSLEKFIADRKAKGFSDGFINERVEIWAKGCDGQLVNERGKVRDKDGVMLGSFPDWETDDEEAAPNETL